MEGEIREYQHDQIDILGGCDVCGGEHETEDCPELVSEEVTAASPTITRARLTLPNILEAVDLDNDDVTRVTVVARQPIAAKTKLGPFEAKKTVHNIEVTDGFVLKLLLKDGSTISLCTNDEDECNWLCLVATATTHSQQNCMALQMGMDIYYTTTRAVGVGEELRVWYAPHYAKKLGKSPQPDGATSAMLGRSLHASKTPDSVHSAHSVGVDFSSVELTELSSDPLGGATPVSTPAASPLKSLRSPDGKPALPTDSLNKCSMCNEKFKKKLDLWEHEQSHRAKIKQEPAFFNEEEVGEDLYDMHQEASFKITSRMVDTLDQIHTPCHLRIQHKQEQVGPHTCSDCGMTFDVLAELANHIKTHLREVERQDRKRKREAKGTPKMGRPKKVSDAEDSPVRTSRRLKARADKKIEGEGTEDKTPNKRRSRKKSTNPITDTEGEEAEDETPKKRRSRKKSADPNSNTSVTIKAEGAEDKTPTKRRSTTKSADQNIDTPKPKRGRPRKTPEISVKDVTPINAESSDSEQKYSLRGKKLSLPFLVELREKNAKTESKRQKKTAEKSKEEQPDAPKRRRGRPRKATVQFIDISPIKDPDVDDADTALNTEETGVQNAAIAISSKEDGGPAEPLSSAVANAMIIAHDVSVSSTDDPPITTPLLESTVHDTEESAEPIVQNMDVVTTSSEETRISLATTVSMATSTDNIAMPSDSSMESGREIFDAILNLDNIDLVPMETSPTKMPPNEEQPSVAPPCKAESQDDDAIEADVPFAEPVSADSIKANSEFAEPVSADSIKADGEFAEPVTADSVEADIQFAEPVSADSIKADIQFAEPVTADSVEADIQFAEPVTADSLEADVPLAEPVTADSIKADIPFGASTNSTPIEPESPEQWIHEALEKMEAEVDDAQQIYHCLLCDKHLTDLPGLQSHFSVHRDAYQCSECSNHYKGQENLENHICPARRPQRKKRVPRKLETDGELHSCGICEKSFEKALYLSRHMQGHSDVFKCNVCGLRFARKESLRIHICVPAASEKTSAKSHFCQFCGAGFNTRTYLLRHMAAHTGEFKCGKCGICFARKETLRAHILDCDPEMIANKKMEAYQCDVCRKVFGKELTLKNHMKVHSGVHRCQECKKTFASELTRARHRCLGDYYTLDADGRFQCKQCNKKYDRLLYLQRHMTIHAGTFKCVVCSKLYSRKEEMIKHMLDCTASLHGDQDGGIECFVCKETFKSTLTYREHFLQHTHPYKCNDCGKLFIRQSRFQTHKCNPWNGQPLECEVCHNKFKHPVTLNKHMERHENKKYECPRCNKMFHRKDYVKDHMCVTDDGRKMRIKISKKQGEVHVEPGAENFVCPHCGRHYSSISNLNKHMLTHGEKNEKCEICGKKFHLKVSLKEHMSVHDPTPTHQCPHCGKLMKNRNSIYNHIQQFHAKVIQFHPCKECGKSFLQKGNLKKHMLLHSTDRKFKCDRCEKTFRYPEQLKRHERWHNEGLKFQCELCDGRFLMDCDLKKHVRNVHSGVLYQCSYCMIECTSSGSIIRHLRKHHTDLEEWQEDSTEYIKSLIQPGRASLATKRRRAPMATQQLEITEQPDTKPFFLTQQDTIDATKPILLIHNEDSQDQQQQQQMVSNLQVEPQILQLPMGQSLEGGDVIETSEEGPYVVAEIKGLSSSGETVDTQTVIIQTGNNQQMTHIPQEVAEALQQLSSHGALDGDQPTIISMGDLGGGASDSNGMPFMLPNHVLAQQEGGGYIMVPMVTGNQEDLQVQEIQM